MRIECLYLVKVAEDFLSLASNCTTSLFLPYSFKKIADPSLTTAAQLICSASSFQLVLVRWPPIFCTTRRSLEPVLSDVIELHRNIWFFEHSRQGPIGTRDIAEQTSEYYGECYASGHSPSAASPKSCSTLKPLAFALAAYESSRLATTIFLFAIPDSCRFCACADPWFPNLIHG